MSGLTILQSAPPVRPGWVDRCLDSVSRWAFAHGHDRIEIGDELFDPIPEDWRRAAGGERLPATDFGRLLWIERLSRGFGRRVCWLDCDIYMADSDYRFPPGDVFCAELWFRQTPDQQIRRWRVNNCAMAFSPGSPLLACYIERCRTALREGGLHRLALGPRLLSAWNAESPLPQLKEIATLSPLLIHAWTSGNERLVEEFRHAWGAPISAFHLCRSLGGTQDGPALVPESEYDRLIDRIERLS